MNKRGRPTKYQDTYPQIALDYLKACENGNKVPWLEELAMLLGVSEDSLQRWVKANSEFCGAIARIKDYQRLCLIKAGLRDNPGRMAMFLLKTVHGMREPKADKYTSC
jgi:hypothetical protein